MALKKKEHAEVMKTVEASAAKQADVEEKAKVVEKKAAAKAEKAGSTGEVKKGCMLINQGKYTIRCPETNTIFRPSIPVLIEDNPTRFMIKQHAVGMLKLR